MVNRFATMQRLSGAIIALTLIVGCGRAKRGDYDEVVTPSQQGGDNQSTQQAATQPASSNSTLANANFGLRNGIQLVANFEVTTGVKFDSISDQDPNKNLILQYQAAAPGDNSVNKFTAGNLSAAVKIATIFCSIMVDRENAARNANGDLSKLIFKNLDLRGNNTALTLNKANKENLSNTMMDLFWGGLSGEADRAKMVEDSLDLADDLSAGIADKNFNDVPSRVAKGMCTAIASSWSGLST